MECWNVIGTTGRRGDKLGIMIHTYKFSSTRKRSKAGLGYTVRGYFTLTSSELKHYPLEGGGKNNFHKSMEANTVYKAQKNYKICILSLEACINSKLLLVRGDSGH